MLSDMAPVLVPCLHQGHVRIVSCLRYFLSDVLRNKTPQFPTVCRIKGG